MKTVLSIDMESFRQNLKQQKFGARDKAGYLAELIAGEVVNHARSLTAQTKPGANKGDGPRKVHPGGWADITSNLANSIKDRVEIQGFSAIAIVEATMEYAAELDERHGYSVLGGADVLARKSIKKHAPEIFG